MQISELSEGIIRNSFCTEGCVTLSAPRAVLLYTKQGMRSARRTATFQESGSRVCVIVIAITVIACSYCGSRANQLWVNEAHGMDASQQCVASWKSCYSNSSWG
eukprot:5324553-Amphidinium_carterae.1